MSKTSPARLQKNGKTAQGNSAPAPFSFEERYQEIEAKKAFLEGEFNKCIKDLNDARTRLELEVAARTKSYEVEIARIKEESRSKDEFIRITNHELRTPLDVIRGNLHMVLKGESGEISETTREYLEDVLAGADRLTKLVNDMLDISRVETDRITFKLEDIDLAKTFETIENEYKNLAQERKLSLRVEYPKEPLHIFSDTTRLFQVLNNLIGNSLKFTPSGGTITLRARGEEDTVVVSVEDAGIGIRPQDQEKLFRRFPDIDTTVLNVPKGTGLGLNLVWQFIKKLGGEVWAESGGLWKGATFSFRLPRPGTQRAEALVRFHSMFGLSA